MAETATLPDRPGRFRYHDGVRDRFGDPLKIQLRLARACPGRNLLALDGLLRDLHPPDAGDSSGEPDPGDLLAVGEALEKLDPILVAGFDLPPYDEATGAGLVATERVQLLTAFLQSLAPAEGDERTEGATG